MKDFKEILKFFNENSESILSNLTLIAYFIIFLFFFKKNTRENSESFCLCSAFYKNKDRMMFVSTCSTLS